MANYQQEDHLNLNEPSCDSITGVDQDEQIFQVTDQSRSVLKNATNDIKFLPQPTSRLSLESVPLIDMSD